MEVALHDAALVEGDLAPRRRGDAEHDAALDLRFQGVGVDDVAAVDGAHHAVDRHLAVLADRHVDPLRHVGAEGELHRDAAAGAGAAGRRLHRRAPAGLGRGELQHCLVARCLVEQVEPVLHRVLAGLDGQLVDEALDDEDVVRGAHAAPERGGQRRLVAHVVHVDVRHRVRNVLGAFDRVAVEPVDG